MSVGSGVDFGEVYDTVDDILRERPVQGGSMLYTGTTAERFNSKLEDSDEVLSAPEGTRLWFTSRVHGRNSAVDYANESLMSSGRDETPAIVAWKVPENWIEEDVQSSIPEGKHLVSSEENEYWANEIPLESLKGYIRPSEGPRIQGDGYLNPGGWEFLKYDE